jgi:hypothetical protein
VCGANVAPRPLVCVRVCVGGGVVVGWLSVLQTSRSTNCTELCATGAYCPTGAVNTVGRARGSGMQADVALCCVRADMVVSGWCT